MLHFHQWDYDDKARERTCHRCGKQQWVHMIRLAPAPWKGFGQATVEWRDYEPSGANSPSIAGNGWVGQ